MAGLSRTPVKPWGRCNALENIEPASCGVIYVGGGRRDGGRAGEQPDDRTEEHVPGVSADVASHGRTGAGSRDDVERGDAVSRALEAMQAARDAWHARHDGRDL